MASATPHSGQECRSGADIGSSFSSFEPQESQRYSYNGMASS
jgi:hypothetical protein